jgi:hypothetical protein
VPESDAGLGVDPHAVAIRPAMAQRVGHPGGDCLELIRSGPPFKIYEACDTAHVGVLFPEQPRGPASIALEGAQARGYFVSGLGA